MTKRAPHSVEWDAKKPIAAVDWLGNRFALGENVLYCIGAGRGQMMAIGVVLAIKAEVKFRTSYVNCEPDDPDAVPYPSDATHFYKMVETPFEDVRVQVRTLKTSGRWGNEERSKPAWVNPMNITALKSVDIT